MHIEIELQSPVANEDIYELRNYLQENLEGFSFHVKEYPPMEGQMSPSLLVPVLVGVIEGLVGLTVHEIYDRFLKPRIDAWLHSKKGVENSSLGILSTIKDDNVKVHFLENSSGKTKVYENVNYAIDTDRTHAILIGSSEFESTFASIPPVKGNLEDFYSLLTNKLHIGLPPENVIVAHNKSNTEIEEMLLQNSRKPGMDTLIIYYAGHGHRTDVKKLYLIARNTKKIDDYILGGIDFDFINNAILKPSAAKQKILILDACHSGIATQGESIAPEVDVKGTYMLTSSQGDEVSYFDKNGRNTYFTGSLIDVLKNGIDNQNKMLALDDLYDYAYEHLQQRNFPHPISKNQLNIPPSKFFIARNPLFSIEKHKRRPAELFEMGKQQDALYEYEILMQEYPDDLNLRREAEKCRSLVLFNQLVYDADELFHTYNNFSGALEKYRKALQIKQDDGIKNKIRKCEERLRSNDPVRDPAVISNKPDKPQTTNDHQEQNTKTVVANKEEKPATIPFQPPVVPVNPEKKNQTATVDPGEATRHRNIIIAISWMIIVALVQVIATQGYFPFYLPSMVVMAVTFIMFFLRSNRMSNTEFIIYSITCLPFAGQLARWYTQNDDTLFFSVLLISIPAFFYYGLLKKRISSFSITQLFFGFLTLIFYGISAGSMIFFSFAIGILGVSENGSSAGNFGGVGAAVGLAGGIALSIMLIKIWRRRVNS